MTFQDNSESIFAEDRDISMAVAVPSRSSTRIPLPSFRRQTFFCSKMLTISSPRTLDLSPPHC